MSDSNAPRCTVCLTANKHGGPYCAINFCLQPPFGYDCFGKPFRWAGRAAADFILDLNVAAARSELDSPAKLLRWFKMQIAAQAVHDQHKADRAVAAAAHSESKHG